MDRSRLEAELAQAERAVIDGASDIAQQVALIERLRNARHPTAQSEELLALLQSAQALRLEERDRLRSGLKRITDADQL